MDRQTDRWTEMVWLLQRSALRAMKKNKLKTLLYREAFNCGVILAVMWTLAACSLVYTLRYGVYTNVTITAIITRARRCRCLAAFITHRERPC